MDDNVRSLRTGKELLEVELWMEEEAADCRRVLLLPLRVVANDFSTPHRFASQFRDVAIAIGEIRAGAGALGVDDGCDARAIFRDGAPIAIIDDAENADVSPMQMAIANSRIRYKDTMAGIQYS